MFVVPIPYTLQLILLGPYIYVATCKLIILCFWISDSILQVYQYTRQRIPTLNEFCVVCDDAHVFQNGAMLKVSFKIQTSSSILTCHGDELIVYSIVMN